MSKRALAIGFGIAFVSGGIAAVLATQHHTMDRVTVAPPPTAPVLAPKPPVPITPATSGEVLTQLAAASDAPVIAVASDKHVWISRDDGKTFAVALEGKGSVTALFVDTHGEVYVHRTTLEDSKVHGVTYVGSRDELGVADREGNEEWHSIANNLGVDGVRDGNVIGAGADIMIGRNRGASWAPIAVAGTSAWSPALIGLDATGDVRMLASRNGKDDAILPGLTLLAAHAGKWKAIWSDPKASSFDGSPCSAFVESTLYVVIADGRGDTIVRVDPNGKVQRTKIDSIAGGIPQGDGMKCAIAGNARAAYLVTDKVFFRLDDKSPHLIDGTGTEADQIDVDHAGDLLALGDRCVVRIHGKQVDEVVCGGKAREH